jgi:hypothetical protein
MQKFTIFSVFFSVILLILVAELFSNDYFNKNENLGASIFGSTDTSSDPTKSLVDDFKGVVRDKADEILDENLPKVNPLSGKKHLTNDFLTQAGFNNPNIETDVFNGKIFDFINLSDVGITDVIKGKIYEKADLSGVYFEIRLDNISTAKEAYTLIMEKAKSDIEVNVNETNSYGESSFYINPTKATDQVYLVIRVRNYVYGFNYPKSNHQKFVELIKIL